MWDVLKSKVLYKSKFLTFKSETCQLANGSVIDNYYSLSCSHWVQVVAKDKDNNFIMIEQYRHAGKNSFLEFPGGAIDDGEKPIAAATRELAEETGYTSNDFKFLGSHFPNPALQSNKIYIYLALDCEKKVEINLDEHEEISTKLIERECLIKCISEQEQHALMLSTLFLYDNYLSFVK